MGNIKKWLKTLCCKHDWTHVMCKDIIERDGNIVSVTFRVCKKCGKIKQY